MSNTNIRRNLVTVVMALVCFASSFAQAALEKGKLYHIYATGNKENVVYEKGEKAVGLANFKKDDTAQFWKVSELSGSWRIIMLLLLFSH